MTLRQKRLEMFGTDDVTDWEDMILKFHSMIEPIRVVKLTRENIISRIEGIPEMFVPEVEDVMALSYHARIMFNTNFIEFLNTLWDEEIIVKELMSRRLSKFIVDYSKKCLTTPNALIGIAWSVDSEPGRKYIQSSGVALHRYGLIRDIYLPNFKQLYNFDTVETLIYSIVKELKSYVLVETESIYLENDGPEMIYSVLEELEMSEVFLNRILSNFKGNPQTLSTNELFMNSTVADLGFSFPEIIFLTNELFPMFPGGKEKAIDSLTWMLGQMYEGIAEDIKSGNDLLEKEQLENFKYELFFGDYPVLSDEELSLKEVLPDDTFKSYLKDLETLILKMEFKK